MRVPEQHLKLSAIRAVYGPELAQRVGSVSGQYDSLPEAERRSTFLKAIAEHNKLHREQFRQQPLICAEPEYEWFK